MYDTVMVGADDNQVALIIVQAFYEVVDVMRFCNVGTEFLSNQFAAKLAAIPVAKP